MKGFTSFPERISEDKVRGKPEKFADHYTQAALFFNSQTPTEQAHIASAFRFELTRVQTAAIRERVVSQLVNVDPALAAAVAEGLGIEVPDAQPAIAPKIAKPEVRKSEALSLFARPGDGSIRTRRVAILVANGMSGASALQVHDALVERGAVPRYVAIRLGSVKTREGDVVEADAALEAAPAVLFDALVIPDGDAAVGTLKGVGQALEFLKDQYRHCKSILALGSGGKLLDAANIPTKLASGEQDPGLLLVNGDDADTAIERFAAAIARHRHFERETDPPRV
jgi:catalase